MEESINMIEGNATPTSPTFPVMKTNKKCQLFASPSEDDKKKLVGKTELPNTPTKGTLEEAYQHLICSMTGTQNKEVAEDIINLGTNAIAGNKGSDEKQNIVFQSLCEHAPQDIYEARLCCQSTALYSQGMKYLARAEAQDRIPQSEFYIKNALKLLRLHNETIEALSKHRRGGEQRVVVQHVQVNDGGKAVVNGMYEGGEKKKISEVAHGHTTHL